MKLLTIQEFANKHGVDKKTIEYRMRKGLKWVDMFGKRLIPAGTKFKKSKSGRPKCA